MDQISKISEDLVQLARLALTGRVQDIQLFVHRVAKRYRDERPELGASLASLLRESPTRASPLRRQADTPVPVDLDSRLQLFRVEQPDATGSVPILTPHLRDRLEQLVGERESPKRLHDAGLQPTRTVLFTGPPGVGKTMGARWLASRMGKPLLILDLAAVMSSFLGRTGNNVRYVLDYAKTVDCVLLLDELDAIAKRRDDQTEIGELKRLVTVLLQEIDDWPSSGLLVAATNHPDLLDPAIWRRFELVVEFPMPDSAQIELLVHSLLAKKIDDAEKWAKIFGVIFIGRSFSDIERQVSLALRAAAIQGDTLEAHLYRLIQEAVGQLSKANRIQLATLLISGNIASQRQAYELTGVSRDTIRKAIQQHTSIRTKRSAYG